MGPTGIDQPLRPMSSGDELSFEIRAHPGEVSVARRTVGQFLGSYGMAPALVDDVQLVTSELVTNALQHGRTGPIGVAVRVQPTVGVTLSVENIGPVSAIPPVTNWSAPEGLARSGRGLGIVRALSDEVAVRGDDERAEIVCTRRWLSEENP